MSVCRTFPPNKWCIRHSFFCHFQSLAIKLSDLYFRFILNVMILVIVLLYHEVGEIIRSSNDLEPLKQFCLNYQKFVVDYADVIISPYFPWSEWGIRKLWNISDITPFTFFHQTHESTLEFDWF